MHKKAKASAKNSNTVHIIHHHVMEEMPMAKNKDVAQDKKLIRSELKKKGLADGKTAPKSAKGVMRARHY